MDIVSLLVCSEGTAGGGEGNDNQNTGCAKQFPGQHQEGVLYPPDRYPTTFYQPSKDPTNNGCEDVARLAMAALRRDVRGKFPKNTPKVIAEPMQPGNSQKSECVGQDHHININFQWQGEKPQQFAAMTCCNTCEERTYRVATPGCKCIIWESGGDYEEGRYPWEFE